MKLFQRTGDQHPLLVLRDATLFPNSMTSVFVNRKASIATLETAGAADRKVLVGFQTSETSATALGDLWPVAVLGRIVQSAHLPDGSTRVLLQGMERRKLQEADLGELQHTALSVPAPREKESGLKDELRVMQELMREYASRQKRVGREMLQAIEREQNPERAADIVCSQLGGPRERRLGFLAMDDTADYLNAVSEFLESEISALDLRKKIATRVKSRLEKNQRDYFIGEQIKELQRELGEKKEDQGPAEELAARLDGKQLTGDARTRALKELSRLNRLQPVSPEAGVIRTYLEWILDLPWIEASRDVLDLKGAGRILDEDHFDMVKPKDRVLDYLAVRHFARQSRSPILCFVGPPGTGKTSLGRSVARALGREFVRVSLGGVRDEAEIRGHRRTYVGALPGRILQGMRRAGTVNPVFLLDEVDKMAHDFRGDPASALLEVLDPEQNAAFADHYLEIPYDLSQVLFITTANSLQGIPYPLLDRMEIIEVPGYTDAEKREIARHFLIPKQLKEAGMEAARIRFRHAALDLIIDRYTLESGVRSLERELGTVIRKIARKAVLDGYVAVREISPEAAADGFEDSGVSAAESGGDSGPGPEVEAEAETPGSRAPDGFARVRLPDPAVHGQPEPNAPETDAPGSAESGGNQADAWDPRATEAQGGTLQGTAGDNVASPESVEGPEGAEEQDGSPLSELSVAVTPKMVRGFLGPPRFRKELPYRDPKPGVAFGLAWTERGGTMLPVEVVVFDGGSDIILTGSLGSVMKESARAALSLLRRWSHRLRLPDDFATNRGVHVHVPEGAIPKDGPSAGVTIATALMSAFTGTAISPGMAMSGEITLTGQVLPVGGIKEKVLAAMRNGFSDVLLPAGNAKDVEDLPREVRRQITFHFVPDVFSVFQLSLGQRTAP